MKIFLYKQEGKDPRRSADRQQGGMVGKSTETIFKSFFKVIFFQKYLELNSDKNNLGQIFILKDLEK